jgi:uncharacterized membrane protein
MANTILGIFDDPIAARRAVDALRDGPLKLADVSIISRATESGATVGSRDDVSAGEGAAVGAVWGGMVGLAALLIPGVGPFVAVGALGAALTGAVTGAVVGGIAAALIDFSGISADEARGYEQQIHAGKTLVAVKARDEDAIEVRRILASAGAASIRDNQTDLTSSTSTPIRVAMYDESGRRVNEQLEYGAPINPTTVRHGIHDLPRIEPGVNMSQPVVEDRPAVDTTAGIGRAGQMQPRESGTGVVDTTRQGVMTPEALGDAEYGERRKGERR